MSIVSRGDESSGFDGASGGGWYSGLFDENYG